MTVVPVTCALPAHNFFLFNLFNFFLILLFFDFFLFKFVYYPTGFI